MNNSSDFKGETKALEEIREEEAWTDWRFSSTIWNFNVGRHAREGVHGLEDRERTQYHTKKNPNKLYVRTAFAGKLVPHLVRKLIHKYSSPGDLILDSFVGSGTIPVEARLNGRRCIGLDVNPLCLELTKKKLSATRTLFDSTEGDGFSILKGDARDLDFIEDESIDLILTHPPYWGLVDFSELENDLSNLSLKDYLVALKEVFQQFYRVLRQGKYCIIVIGDVRKRGVIPLGSYLVHIGLKAGFNLWDLIIYDTRFGGKQVEKYRKIRSQQKKFHLTDHDYVLVFQKRDQGWHYIELEDLF